ncbi:MAG: DNA-directed RNA polymerase subunit alpha [Mycoplasmatales bacterium]
MSIYNFNMIFPKVKVLDDQNDPNHKQFQIDPLESGFGITVGNALRRISLSSLPGGAVKQISIKGVSHEFDVLPTIIEDITTVVLAVKDLKLCIDNQDEDYILTLRANKAGILTAADIECPAGVEIVNKECKIVTLAEDKEFYMEFVASKGLGYVLAENNRGKEKKANVIYIDSIYTPVTKFSYTVEDTRVGDKTNFDKLILDIYTNGTITPEEALSYSSHIMKEHMFILENIEETIERSKVFQETRVEIPEILDVPNEVTSIETLDISNRAYNGLKRAGINTIEELCEKSKKEISSLDNIGAKTVDEIEKQLEELGYSFK